MSAEKKDAGMLEEVINFVSEHTGIEKHQLSSNTKIEDDIGFAELDTLIFYDEFFHFFQIGNASEFDADKYVSSMAPENLFSSIWVKNTTIRHLTQVAFQKDGLKTHKSEY